MRHLLYPTSQIEEDVWVAACSCGFRELHSTQDDARRATEQHDMSDLVWRDRHDRRALVARFAWGSQHDDGGTASEPGDDYRTTRQADDA